MRIHALGPAAAAIVVVLALPAAGGGAATPPPAPNPCLNRSLHLRCPDLVMSAPRDFILDRSTHYGRTLLRARSSIDNHGKGPLEIHGRRSGRTTMVAAQAIDRRGGGHSLFHTGARLGFKYVSGNRYGYGNLGSARYWKFRDAARFGLWRVDSHNKLLRFVKPGPKLFYCFRDLQHTRPSGRSPSHAVYPACNQNSGQRRVILGTSVGWSDVYPAAYPEQFIDVSGLRGRFAYVQTADPYGRIYESHEGNNSSATFIRLPSGRVVGHRVGFSLP
jgi:hypothetical protein